MFDDFIALLWQSKEIVAVIIVFLIIFIGLTIVARFNG